jgi:RNA polymerase sigma factor for flagellar operon FliA
VQQGAGDSPEVLERFQAELALVEIIAGQVTRSIGSAVDHDDLLGAGREGLFDAARKYDSTRGIPFRAYANLRVRGAILDGVRNQAHLPRRAHERFTALEVALAESEAELGPAHSPTTANLAAGDAERRMAAHLANVATAAALGVSTRTEDSGADAATDESLNPEEQLAQAELIDLVRRSIDQMAPDEAGVIRAYYFENKSMNDIAEQDNLSKSWISRLHAQAIGRLTRQIKNSV